MQWYVLVSLLIFVAWATNVKSILAFSFFAIVTFIFAQNLLDSRIEFDLFGLFGRKSINYGKPSKAKPFPQTLLGCKRTLIKYILRDFVISWFENVGIGDKFVLETRTILEEATESLYEKMVLTNVSSFSDNLCIILHKHFVAFRTARDQDLFQCSQVNVQAYESFKKRVFVEKQDEINYLRTVIDLLLQKLIKKQTLDCNAGRFILREILAVNLLFPILNKLSDPHFLNQSIINVFGETKHECDTCGENNLNDNCTSPKSVLMACLDDKLYSDSNFVSTNVQEARDTEPSVKYKFKDRTIIEKEHQEHVEISMETNAESKNQLKPLLNGLKENFSKTLFGTCSAKDNKNKEKQIPSKGTTSLATGIAHSTMVANVECESKNTCENKANSSKPLEIFGVKVQPVGLMFGRNLKRFHPPSVIKQIPILKKCADESIILPQDFHKKDDAISTQNVDKNLEKTTSESPQNLEDLSEMCTSTRYSLSEPMSSVQNSETDVHVTSSDLEEKHVSDFLYIEEDTSQQRGKEIDEEYYNIENPDHELVDDGNVFKRSTETSTDDSLPSHEDPPCRNLSSSVEEWDTDVFENFTSDEGEFLKTSPDEECGDMGGKQCQSLPSVGELAFPKSKNPCLLINILRTELITDGTWEPHKSKYTVYHISYSDKLWSKNDNSESDDDEISSTDENNVIRRRYREFMELHHRLSNGPYASCLKEVPKPNRKFNSPFFRLDEDVVEGRQHLLETYLKGLVTHLNILNSEEFKGFLGIGDESQTIFRRQIIVPGVPRIDKKLQKKVNKLIDHIKTAFDTGPMDGDKEEEYNDIRQVLGEDRLSSDEIRTYVICSSGCRLSHSCCYAEKRYQKFIQEEQTDSFGLKQNIRTKSETPKKSRHAADCAKRGVLRKSYLQVPEAHTSPKNRASVVDQQKSFPLTETIFNLSCELLQDQESWVSLDLVQQAATTVFGCLFEWWFESLIGELITEEQWQYYLTLLQKTIWPNGKLMDHSEEEAIEEDKEQQEKAKEDAVETLSDFFGGILHLAIGSDAIKSSARNLVESFQCEEINRQLVLEVLEIILVEIFPEIIREKETYLHNS